MTWMQKWTNRNFPWCFKCERNTGNRLINNKPACGWCDEPKMKVEPCRLK